MQMSSQAILSAFPCSQAAGSEGPTASPLYRTSPMEYKYFPLVLSLPDPKWGLAFSLCPMGLRPTEIQPIGDDLQPRP